MDGISVEELKAYLREHKEELRSQIRQRKYNPQPTLRVEIPKGNGKTRQLGIPTVVDRVIQQAISQILTTVLKSNLVRIVMVFDRIVVVNGDYPNPRLYE